MLLVTECHILESLKSVYQICLEGRKKKPLQKLPCKIPLKIWGNMHHYLNLTIIILYRGIYPFIMLIVFCLVL